MTSLPGYQLFCCKDYVTRSLQYTLQCNVNVVITASGGLKFVKQEQLYKAILHQQSILIKTKFITITFHLQWPSAVAQRETLHMFRHTAFKSFTICGLFVSV